MSGIPTGSKARKRDWAVVAGLIFLSGVSCNEAWGDREPVRNKVETKIVFRDVPKLVFVPKKPVEQVTKPTALSDTCKQALGDLAAIRALDAKLAAAVEPVPTVLQEAHQVFVTGTASELVPITEELTRLRQAAINISIAKAELLITYDKRMAACDRELKADN